MSLSWGVSKNKQLDIERATQKQEDTIIGIEEEIEVIFEVDLAGEIAHIFKTEYSGKPLYLISLDEDFNGELKVVQPELKSDLELRIEALDKEGFKAYKSKKEFSGPAEIRTQDLRRVKATS